MLRRSLLAGSAWLALLAASEVKAFPLWTGGAAGPAFSGILTTATVVNGTGSSQTNVPIQFGLPVLGGNLPSSNIIQVLDSDGVTPLVVQEDNHCSDFTPNVRHTTITAILPSLTNGQTKQLTVKSIAGSAAAGTAIVASDITGLVSGTFEPAKLTFVIGGTTYTASCATALAAGSTWSLTAAVNHGSWRSGPFCTEFICSTPAFNGGTPHDYLRVWFHVAAYKAGSGAVTAQGGANPITAIRVFVIPENGYAQQHTSASADLYYSCLVQQSTSLTNATLITVGTNWTNDTSGPGTLTNSSVDGNGNSTLTRGTGTWGQNDYGRVIKGTAGGLTGLGQIISVTVGGTTATFRNITTFSSSSWSSGNYTMYGVGHAYGSRWRQQVNYGSVVAHPESTQITFSLWDGTGGTPTLMPYLAKTKMVLNYATTIANTTNGAVNWGTRPYATNMATEPMQYEQPDYFPASGDASYIGVLQACEVDGAIKFDANGQLRIFNNADARMWQLWHHRDTVTGLTPTLNNGTDWSWSGSWGTELQLPATTTALTSGPHGALDPSHTPGPPYIAWLTTGDFVWVEECHWHGFFFGWAGSNPADAGSQLNRFFWLEQGFQQRAQAWATRSTIQAWASTPDSATGLLGISKSQWKTFLTTGWSQCVTKYVNDTTTYSVNGPRWTCGAGGFAEWGSVNAYAEWQVSYCLYVLGHALETGCLDMNGVSFRNWFQPQTIVPYTDNNTNVASDWQAGAYWLYMNTTTQLTTFAQIYQATAQSRTLGCQVRPGNAISASLSAATGAITVTFSGGNPFTNGGSSFYVNGWLAYIDGGGNLISYALITSVNVGANTCVIDTTATRGGVGGASFAGHTSIPAGNLGLPWPAPGDAPARGTQQPAGTSIGGYWQYGHGASLLWQNDGVANASAAAAYYLAQFTATGAASASRFFLSSR